MWIIFRVNFNILHTAFKPQLKFVNIVYLPKRYPEKRIKNSVTSGFTNIYLLQNGKKIILQIIAFFL